MTQNLSATYHQIALLKVILEKYEHGIDQTQAIG